MVSKIVNIFEDMPFIFEGHKYTRYIRCLKPNFTKTPNNYDSEYILEQLKYLGILDLVQIKQSGYPVHYSFQEFINKFKILIQSREKVTIE